jgi:AbrB family looped-hinge helix DNA binding protein
MNKKLDSSITSKYQITIPKTIREKFPEFKKSNKVQFKIVNNQIIIKPKKRLKDVIGIMGPPPISGKGMSFEDIRKEAYKEARKI